MWVQVMGLWFRIVIGVGLGCGFVISNYDQHGSGLWVCDLEL